MKGKNLFILLVSILVIMVLAGTPFMGACAKAAQAPAPAPAPKPATAPAPAPAPTPAPAKITAIEQLYELAKKEGELVWNLGPDRELYQPVIAAFTKKYPGIKVSTTSISPGEMPARIITEYGAGKVSIDVSRQGMVESIPLKERDIIVTHDWTGFNMDEKYLRLDYRVVLVLEQPWVMMYNNKLVSEAEAPRSYEDLLNPRWKGKISLTRPLQNFSALERKWGAERSTEYMKNLAKQGVLMAARGAANRDTVARGEALIGNLSMNLIMEAKRDNLPIDLAPISPGIGTVMTLLQFKGAPHPNAAKLLSVFLTTPEARELMAAFGHGPIHSIPGTSPEPEILKKKGVEILWDDTFEIAKKAEATRAEIAKIMGFVAK